MADAQFITALSIGFVLGTRHAFDPDHVAAVATIVSKQAMWRSSVLIGLLWGCGHTVMLVVAGVIILGLKISVPDRLANLFEGLVGVMLIGLGGTLAWTLAKERMHLHRHSHDGHAHAHLHSHRHRPDHQHTHGWAVPLRSFAVGMVHGLAGSAAVALLAVSTAGSVGEAVVFLLLFGLGSILGMMGMGLVICLPFALTATGRLRWHALFQGAASLGSIVLGVVILVRSALA